jgi:hypothetical protein
LAPYIQISQWGQWFAVQTIYTCLANQTVCTYYQPTNPPAGSGPGGGSPLPGALSSITTPGLPAPSTTKNGQSSLADSSIPDLLNAVGGQGSGASSKGSSK